MNAAQISIVTLGVDDLEQSLKFYEALDWKNSDHSQETVKFLQGNNVVLGLYNSEDLAKDAGAEPGNSEFCRVSLAINLESEAAVDAYFAKAVAAGATPKKPPKKAFWGGYSSYFSDPDGHYWEVAHNPFFKLDADGNLNLGANN